MVPVKRVKQVAATLALLAVVMLLPAAIVLHIGVVKREERYLSAKFGDAYRHYSGTVPRYGWPPH